VAFETAGWSWVESSFMSTVVCTLHCAIV
jgi:hypothetical protein